MSLFVRGGSLLLDQDGAWPSTARAFTIGFPASAPQRMYLSDIPAHAESAEHGPDRRFRLQLPLFFPMPPLRWMMAYPTRAIPSR